MKISKHISYKEGVHSNTAKRKGIENTPDEEQLANMKTLAEKIFEPLRKWVDGPIKINSFLDVQSLIKLLVDQVSLNIVKVKL